MAAPSHTDQWCELSSEPLPVDDVSAWIGRPECGAEVVFVGAARDHAEGRPGVFELFYEAYEDQVVSSFDDIVERVRDRHPGVARMAVLHRVGSLAIGDAAVVVAVPAAHRDAAFDACREAIDLVKVEAPIWKRERWAGGDDWGFTDQQLRAGSAGVGT
ncbi:MAG: molybdenum cofactor biosynthesis protein MoaE [Microthrixaceae bacterium]